MASKKWWKQTAKDFDAALIEQMRRIAWIRSIVQQWHDNEITKSLPPMRRDQAEGQICKSNIRSDAYRQVLMMFDAPVPATFGREDDEEDA